MDQYGLIGNPVKQSKSPLIYRLFAEETAQVIEYSPVLVAMDAFEEVLGSLKNEKWKGVNITLPFKHRAFNLMDTLSERAQHAEAINTIIMGEDGLLHGDNTDGVGLVRDLLINLKFSIEGKRVLILGAGGAVRGVIGPVLQENPSEVIISNRTESKSVALAEAFAEQGRIQACELSLLEIASFDLVINGTSASLQDEMLDLPGSILKPGAMCYDMVYGRGVTPFLRWAMEQDAEFCVDGLGMLVEQAAESFYLWRQVKPNTQRALALIKQMLAPAEVV